MLLFSFYLIFYLRKNKKILVWVNGTYFSSVIRSNRI